MDWLSLEKAAESPCRNSLEALVRQQETSCIDAVPLLDKSPIVHTNGKNVDAALFFTSYGRIIPVLGKDFLFHQEDVRDIAYLAGNAVYLPTSVSGRKEAVDMFLERFSCGQREQVLEHYIMELDRSRFKNEPVPEQLRIKICKGSLRHLLPLLPLQRTYEIQEVLLDPGTIDTLETYRWLKSILTREICFYAKRGFRYVSKANTNARGFDHLQIGGVFTDTRFRNQGYAYYTVSALCRHILEEENMIPSLFVKKDNEKAIKLYKRLGFEITDSTKTVYLN